MDRSYLKIFEMVLSLDDDALEKMNEKLAENRNLASDEKQWLSDLAKIIKTEREDLYKKWFG